MRRTGWKGAAVSLTAAFAVAGLGSLQAPRALAATEEQKQHMADRLEEMKKRLNLTPDQEARIRPLVQQEREKIQAIRQKYAGDTSRKARTSMMQELKPVRQHFQQEVEKILTPDQMKEWAKMRQEMKEELKERHKAKAG
jgi:Spy/CpxP family protein refolding chaperone